MIQFLVHEKSDTVGVATVDLRAGEAAEGLCMENHEPLVIKVLQDIPLGHKVALHDHGVGENVIKYGHEIGKVVQMIKKGQHVHVQNLKTGRW